jgi:type IV pilus assembly protein PilV
MTGNDNGFTLVEFLVAIVILMVGMLGLLQSLNVAIEHNLGNILRSEAVMLADDRMMLKRTKAFESISTTVSSPSAIPVVRSTRGISKSYSVQEIVNQATPLSKEIIVNVSWSYKSNTYSHSLSSIISRFPQ